MAILKFPYTNLHEINLDWIIEQLNKDGPVLSVNTKQGVVVLTGEDIARSTSDPETIAHALTAQGTSIQTARNQIGTTPLPTTAQTLTGAIAEHETDISGIDDTIGTTPLPTVAQTLTGAIAENAGEIADQEDLIGSTALPTTAQTITGAIAEHETDIVALNNKTTFIQRTVGVPYECTANGQYNTNLKTIIDADVPADYTVLGIVGFSTNNVKISFIACRYAETAYSFQVINLTADTVSHSASVTYLAKHN